MTDQFSFPGFDDAKSGPTDRLFFAIFPECGVAEEIARLAKSLRREAGLRGEPLRTDRFHVTLHHLGDYSGFPEGIAAEACEAAARIDAPSFDVVFDRAGSFAGKPGRCPYVLRGGEGVAPLSMFQKRLGLELMKVGLERRVKPSFTPHLTMLYGDSIAEERLVDEVRWKVDEFVLVHSLLGRTRHLRLASWPLVGS